MTNKFVTDYLDKKIKENDKFLKISYYELRVKNNLSNNEIDEFLNFSKSYLENNDYHVYFTNEQYYFNGNTKIVETNEVIIAIKNYDKRMF